MKVLVACEFSGVVRDAFLAKGHDAISCDLLPTESPGPHIQGDVLPLLSEPWDLVIAHPPCTYLCNSGVCWLYRRGTRERDEERWAKMRDAARFFGACYLANAGACGSRESRHARPRQDRQAVVHRSAVAVRPRRVQAHLLLDSGPAAAASNGRCGRTRSTPSPSAAFPSPRQAPQHDVSGHRRSDGGSVGLSVEIFSCNPRNGMAR